MTIRQRPVSPPRIGLVLSCLALSTSALVACGGPMEQDETLDEIIGGQTDPGDPMVVALLAASGRGEGLCTATVISPTVLLTAAHCVAAPPNAAVTYTVVRDTQISRTSVRLPVKRVAYNPLYNGNNIEAGHDTAVVVLRDPIDTPPVPINRTPLTNALIGQPSRLVGYGLNNAQAQTGSGLKRQVTTRFNSYTQTLVQIGEPQRDTCNGDSGGPAFMTINGREVIVGITSFGSAECVGDGQYTRVDTELTWIDQQLALEAPAEPPPPPPAPETPPPTPTPEEENPAEPETPTPTPPTVPQPSNPTPQTPPQTTPQTKPNGTSPGDQSSQEGRDGFSGEFIGGSCTCLNRSGSTPGAGGLALLALGLFAVVRRRPR